MAESKTPSPDYLNGFNQGYAVADAIKDFAPKVEDPIKENSRLEGIIHGTKQRNKERYLQKLKSKAPTPDKTPKPDKTSKPDKGIDR